MGLLFNGYSGGGKNDCSSGAYAYCIATMTIRDSETLCWWEYRGRWAAAEMGAHRQTQGVIHCCTLIQHTMPSAGKMVI